MIINLFVSKLGKKLFTEWNALTAINEFVVFETFPIPQLPKTNMPKNKMFEEVSSKLRCHKNHKVATIIICIVLK